MSKLGTQRDYWNSRAGRWGNYDVPLIPSQGDIDFQGKQLVSDGDILILGATPELCKMALKASKSVTAVDFAGDIIEALRHDDVKYKCAEWRQFLEQSADKFDNIMTDGGLNCLEFPNQWEQLAGLIRARLKKGGIFSARVYVSTGQPPKNSYQNPNLERFISGMSKVDHNWMLGLTNGDYKGYDVRYSFPPDKEVLRAFDRLTLLDRLTPDYEEGKRFVSYAWQRT